MAEQFIPDVWVGSEIGYLKAVDLQKKSFNNMVSPTSELGGRKSEEICNMCWTNSERNQMVLGLHNGLVKTFDTEKNTIIAERDCDVQESRFVGLFCYDRSTVTCTESGVLKTWTENESPISINVGSHISKMCNSEQNPNYIGTGGKENDLKIWDLSRAGQNVFKARNVRNDNLDLRVPVWVTSLGFLPSSGSSCKVVTGTGYHQIRVYDTSAQGRPVLSVEFEDCPIYCLSVTNQENIVIVGNAVGTVAAVDLRKGQVVGHFKGFAGGVRCIGFCEENGQVAACGLDRFLRVYDISSRSLLHKVYLKTRLNCLLFSRMDIRNKDKAAPLKEEYENCQPLRKRERRNVEEDDDEEVDLLWDSLEVVKTKKVRRKKKSSDKSKQV